jgi:hypothetical protein
VSQEAFGSTAAEIRRIIAALASVSRAMKHASLSAKCS